MSRSELILKSHMLEVKDLLSSLTEAGDLLYQSGLPYVKGHDYLASNEFNFYENQFKVASAQLTVGFGTNSVWDLALKSGSKEMIIADWSPWPE